MAPRLVAHFFKEVPGKTHGISCKRTSHDMFDMLVKMSHLLDRGYTLVGLFCDGEPVELPLEEMND